jgi:ubiquinone/menaquinone biosynthesis C-methylase UbiE
MSRIADQHYLLAEQYRDAANLDARVRLHRLYSINKYGWNRWCFDQFSLPSNAHVLELGCGPGYLWRDNLDRTLNDWAVTLSDFSAGMVHEAQAGLGNRRQSFRFVVIDAQSIPCDDGTFDAVIANHMLYHVPVRARAIGEIRRVLRSGGCAYIATNGDAHLQELHDLVARFDANLEFGWSKRAHEQFSLDNGGDEVRRRFDNAIMRRYDDALRVTDAEPLVDYILSMSTATAAQSRRLDLMYFIEDELASRGTIYITKDAGMFICLAS